MDVHAGAASGQVVGAGNLGTLGIAEVAGDHLPALVAGQDGVVFTNDVARARLAPLGVRGGGTDVGHDLGTVEAGITGLQVDVVPVDGVHVLLVEKADIASVGLAVLAYGEKDDKEGAQTKADAEGNAKRTAVAAGAVGLGANDFACGGGTAAADDHFSTGRAAGDLGVHLGTDDGDGGDSIGIGSPVGVGLERLDAFGVARRLGGIMMAVDADFADVEVALGVIHGCVAVSGPHIGVGTGAGDEASDDGPVLTLQLAAAIRGGEDGGDGERHALGLLLGGSGGGTGTSSSRSGVIFGSAKGHGSNVVLQMLGDGLLGDLGGIMLGLHEEGDASGGGTGRHGAASTVGGKVDLLVVVILALPGGGVSGRNGEIGYVRDELGLDHKGLAGRAGVDLLRIPVLVVAGDDLGDALEGLG